MADAAQTLPTGADVGAFLNAVPDPRRRSEGWRLHALFGTVTGYPAAMWGPSIVGFGRYDYTYASGHGGTAMATGFSPRKAECVIYILPGHADLGPILARLGPHRAGKSCLYLRRLDAVDEGALADLIRAGLERLGRLWPVRAQ